MLLTPRIWNWKRPEPEPGWLADPDVPGVWQASLVEDALLESHLISVLTAEERARRERFQRREDRRRFLTGLGLLRLLIGAHLKIPAASVELGRNAFGKPFLMAGAAAPVLHFNVAHSGKIVLLAFHRGHEVGVDVEEMRLADDLAALARRVFAPDEYHGWLQLGAAEQPAAFFRQWTHHEARLKALGVGLGGQSSSAAETRLTCCDLVMPAGYQGAVAWNEAGHKLD